MNTVLVTGATGFIGNKLCTALAEEGQTVHALCRDEKSPLLPKHKNILPFKGDILNEASLTAAMQGCRHVYHTAALAKMWVKDKNEFYTVNVTGTKNVLDAAMQNSVEKVVHTSTCGVWGPTVKHPMAEDDPRITGFAIDYERTKYLAELEVQNFAKQGMHIVTVNPSRVYGEGPVTESNTVGKMVSAYLRGKWRFIPGSGEQVANYAFLSDVIDGHITAMDHGISGERYILGGEDISFNEFFNTVHEVSGKRHRLIHLPLKAIEFYSHIEKLKTQLTGLRPFFLPEFAERLKYDQKYSSNKAMTHLGYRITPFAEGMHKTINYLQQA